MIKCPHCNESLAKHNANECLEAWIASLLNYPVCKVSGGGCTGGYIENDEAPYPRYEVSDNPDDVYGGMIAEEEGEPSEWSPLKDDDTIIEMAEYLEDNQIAIPLTAFRTLATDTSRATLCKVFIRAVENAKTPMPTAEFSNASL